MSKYIWVFNANQGCISWQEIQPTESEQQVLDGLKNKFSSAEFTFKIMATEPKVPDGGYTSDQKLTRRIRFVKNIT